MSSKEDPHNLCRMVQEIKEIVGERIGDSEDGWPSKDASIAMAIAAAPLLGAGVALFEDKDEIKNYVNLFKMAMKSAHKQTIKQRKKEVKQFII